MICLAQECVAVFVLLTSYTQKGHATRDLMFMKTVAWQAREKLATALATALGSAGWRWGLGRLEGSDGRVAVAAQQQGFTASGCKAVARVAFPYAVQGKWCKSSRVHLSRPG